MGAMAAVMVEAMAPVEVASATAREQALEPAPATVMLAPEPEPGTVTRVTWITPEQNRIPTPGKPRGTCITANEFNKNILEG